MNNKTKNIFMVFLVTPLSVLLLFAIVALSTIRAPIEFVSADYPKEVRAGEGFEFSITLRSHRAILKDCSLFIHLVGGNQFINADVDLPHSTVQWESGKEIKLGPFKIYMPVNAQPGHYQIGSGLFYTEDSPTGPRYVRLFYCNPLMWGWSVGSIKVLKRAPTADFLDRFVANDYAVAVENSLVKVFCEKEYYSGSIDGCMELTACQGEYEARQLVIIPGIYNVNTIFLDKSDLVSEDNGHIIEKANIDIFLVGYVKTRRPYYNTLKVGLWPDPLIPLDQPFDVASQKVQPVWVRIYVPQNTPAGTYLGEIFIKALGMKEKKVIVKLEVYGFNIASKKHLKTAFGFDEYILEKFYPQQANETEEEWKKRKKDLSTVFYLDMLSCGLDPIHNMGNPQFLGKEDGEYKLDFTEFDKKVKFYKSYGQKNFGIGQYWPWQSKAMWGKWYGLVDEESVLGVFRAYGRHLQEKGWLDNAYAYIFDETFHRVKEITALIHQAHPGIKNLLTMPPNRDYPDIDIWCVRLNNFDEDTAKDFRSDGKQIWTYVAGTTRPYPNLNLDVPAMECRIIPWILWKYKIEGFLYWSVNYWELSNPWEDAMNFPNQNGDGFLYYPGPQGPVGSIRLEVLRDGLEDYEYLYLLNERLNLLKAKKATDCKPLIEEIEAVLQIKDDIVGRPAYYTIDPARILAERRRIALLIEKAGAVLNNIGEGE